MDFRLLSTTILMAFAGLSFSPALAGEISVAGIEPSSRPENAPVITDIDRDDAWFAEALTGVEEPYPSSLLFLEDQGNWFNPFGKPGMTGPYDIRGWH